MMQRMLVSCPASRLVTNIRQFNRGWQQKADVGSSPTVEQQIIRHVLNANTAALSELLSNRLDQKQFPNGNIFRDGLKFLASCGEIDQIIKIRNSMQLDDVPISARLSDYSWSKLLLDAYFNVGQLEKYAEQLSIKLCGVSLERADVEREVFYFMLLAVRHSPAILHKFLDATRDSNQISTWRDTTINLRHYVSLGSLQWRAYVCNEQFEQADAMLTCKRETMQVPKNQIEKWICLQFRHIDVALGLMKEADKTSKDDNDSDDGENEPLSSDPDPELLLDRQKARKFLQKATKKRTAKVLPELSTIELLIQRIRTQSRTKVLEHFEKLFRTHDIDLACRQRNIVRSVYTALLEDYVSQQNWPMLQTCVEQTASLLHVALEPQGSIASNLLHRAAIEDEAKRLGIALQKAKHAVLLKLNSILSGIDDTEKVNDSDRSSIDSLVAINSRLRTILAQLDALR